MVTRQMAREDGRIILAHGEVTGHRHEIVTEAGLPPDLETAQYFDDPDGRRLLVVLEGRLELAHAEHSTERRTWLYADGRCEAVAVVSGLVEGRGYWDPADPRRGQVRQGDVLLTPIAAGMWQVERQSEGYTPEAWTRVAD